MREVLKKMKDRPLKRVAIVLVLALSLLLVPTAVQAAGVSVVDRTGDGTWVNNNWQVSIYPSETKSTALSLYNSSSSSLDVEVTVTPNLLDNGNLTFELDKSSFTMSGRSYTDVTLTVKASGSATPGIYTTELTIKSEVPTLPPSGGGGGGISIFRLYNLSIEGITENSADILWRTSRATTSVLTYWSSPKITVRDKNYVTKHLVHLKNLKDNTTYYFKIESEDKYGLEKTVKGKFTTLEGVIPEPTPEPEPVLPELEEPEPVVPEPTLPEPWEPTPLVPERLVPWGLIVGVVAGLVIVSIATFFLIRVRGKKKVRIEK